MKLLTRLEFFDAVFQRDKKSCVNCGEKAIDAHHLIDRKCFSDGGYYIDNGVALCSACHLNAEQGFLSPQFLRICAGIKNVVLPKDFNPALEYNKWGNVIDEMNFLPQIYNPEYGDDKPCMCGHVYSKHFDTSQKNHPMECKYCRCRQFILVSEQAILP